MTEETTINKSDDDFGPGSSGHDGAEKVPLPNRFQIMWHGFHYGYRVSIPGYEGGEVVIAEAYDALREALLKFAVQTTESGPCWCSADPRVFGHGERCEAARAALSLVDTNTDEVE